MTDLVTVALTELADWWPELEADLAPGTTRPWSERQQERDATGRRIPLAADTTCDSCGSTRLRTPDQVTPSGEVLPGKPYCPAGCDDLAARGALGRAPARMDVLYAIADLTTGTLNLEHDVRAHLGEPLERPDDRDPLQPPRPTEPTEVRIEDPSWHKQAGREAVTIDAGRWYTGATPAVDTRVPSALRWLAAHHQRVTDAALRARIAKEAMTMSRTLRGAVGAAERVVRLGEPCPVCGHLSLAGFLDRCSAQKYRRCSDEKCTAQHGVIYCLANDGEDEPLCECSRNTCSCHRGGRHYWDPEEFRHLGLVLEVG